MQYGFCFSRNIDYFFWCGNTRNTDSPRTAIRELKKGSGGNQTQDRRAAATASPAVSDSDTMRNKKTIDSGFLVRIFKYSRWMEIRQDSLNMFFIDRAMR